MVTERTQDGPVHDRITLTVSAEALPAVLQLTNEWAKRRNLRVQVIAESLRQEIRERLDWQGDSTLLLAIDGPVVRLTSAQSGGQRRFGGGADSALADMG